MTVNWKDTAARKRAATLDLIPPEWRIPDIPDPQTQKDVTGDYIDELLTQKEGEITATDAVGIAEKIADRTWTALEVIEAFCHRAAIAHQLLNCLHEIFFDDARADARALDEYLKTHEKPKGALAGVPVSLKDQFHVRKVETSMGYVGWIGTFEGIKDDPRRLTYESEMVRELRECGAILYCKTSVPHTLMSGETFNNIIGYTLNPKNRQLSSGGSSGGEGALIGFRGSPLGLGSDIGGSVRIPAGFNGLYGLRPTSGRMPYRGTANSMDGQNSVLSVLGPIATTARSLRLMMTSILSRRPWDHDPLVVDMPWRPAEEQAIADLLKQPSSPKLTFGVYRNDGIVIPQPPVMRALNMVVEAVRSAGHEVIEWQPPSHTAGCNLIFKAWLYDSGTDVHSAFGLSGEDIFPGVVDLYQREAGQPVTAVEVAANNVALRKWREEYTDYWNSSSALTSSGRPVDAVISPLAPYAAARPKLFKHYHYTMWVNGLDYTSAVIPVTNADKRLDPKPDEFRALSDLDQFVYDNYDADVYDGAPVGLQLVGRRYTEEKMIAIAEHVGALLGK